MNKEWFKATKMPWSVSLTDKDRRIMTDVIIYSPLLNTKSIFICSALNAINVSCQWYMYMILIYIEKKRFFKNQKAGCKCFSG